MPRSFQTIPYASSSPTFFHIFFDIWSDLCPKCFEMFWENFVFSPFLDLCPPPKCFEKWAAFDYVFQQFPHSSTGWPTINFGPPESHPRGNDFGIRIYPPGGVKKSFRI